MSKFIQTVDEDGDPVIINLDAVSHVLRMNDQVKIYFEHVRLVTLMGENADIVWELFSKQSLYIYQQPEEDKK